MTGRAAREQRRARSSLDRRGRRRHGETGTGHAALFQMRPALELDTFPSGGGYPVGFVEAAARLMGADLRDLVHVCSGSVRGGRLTIDVRPESGADVVADVRWLPLRPGSVQAILADPPYAPEYAEELWGLGRLYPTPITLLREAESALAPGGRVGLLHHIVPVLPPGLRRLGCYGVSTGPGYRMRAFTICERPADGVLEV